MNQIGTSLNPHSYLTVLCDKPLTFTSSYPYIFLIGEIFGAATAYMQALCKRKQQPTKEGR
jgi:hypothetical protein